MKRGNDFAATTSYCSESEGKHSGPVKVGHFIKCYPAKPFLFSNKVIMS